MIRINFGYDTTQPFRVRLACTHKRRLGASQAAVIVEGFEPIGPEKVHSYPKGFVVITRKGLSDSKKASSQTPFRSSFYLIIIILIDYYLTYFILFLIDFTSVSLFS